MVWSGDAARRFGNVIGMAKRRPVEAKRIPIASALSGSALNFIAISGAAAKDTLFRGQNTRRTVIPVALHRLERGIGDPGRPAV